MFVIVSKKDGSIVLKKDGGRYYVNAGAAQAAITRAAKLRKRPGPNAIPPGSTVVEASEYHEPQVQRRNPMTGELFWRGVNAPHYCSPASEARWGM